MTCSQFYGNRVGYDEFLRMADTGYSLLSNLHWLQKEGKSPQEAIVSLHEKYDATDWDASNGYFGWLLTLHDTASGCHTSHLRDHIGFWGHSEAVDGDVIEQFVEMYCNSTPDPYPLHPFTESLQLNVFSSSAEAIRIWLDPVSDEIVPIDKGIEYPPIYLPECDFSDESAQQKEFVEREAAILPADQSESVPQPQSESGSDQDHAMLVLSRDDFTVQYRGGTCQLGNVIAFILLERLNRRPGIYISLDTLITDVWKGTVVSNEAVQKQKSLLKKKLHDAGMSGITIDGRQRHNYRLVLT
jgi:hypothetical protein